MLKDISNRVPWIFLPLAMGCGFSVPYTPIRPPVPLVTHQGELDLSGGVDFPAASGFVYQAIYAPANHVSTYAAFQFDRHTGGTYMSGPQADFSDYNNHFFDFGLGYFDSIHSARYEAYLLGGFGAGNDHQTDWNFYQTDTTTLNVFRIGIQQNIGLKNDVRSLGVGLGLGYEHLYNLHRNATNYDKHEIDYYDSAIAISSILETASQSTFYAEPALFCSVGVPVSSDGNQLFVLRCTAELWFIFRTNAYAAFGSGNGSITLSLDF